MTALPTLARRLAAASFVAAAIVALPAHATATDELRSFVKTVKTGRATFTQTVTSPDGRQKVSKGSFDFARPSRFRFVYEKPYAQTVVGDGTKVWIYDPDLNQVSARKMGTALGATPAALLVSTDIDQASHVVVFLYTAPIFAALGLQMRLPEERLERLQWAGIGLAFCGIAFAFLGGGELFAGGAAMRGLLGDALALLAGAAWGATTVTLRGSTLAAAPATEALFYQLLGAFVLLLPAAWLGGQWHFEPTPTVLAHLAFQSVVVSFASFLTWFWLLRHYRASQLGVFSFLTPLFGVGLGVWLLGESLTFPFVVGSVFVLAGIGLVSGHVAVARWVAGALGRR